MTLNAEPLKVDLRELADETRKPPETPVNRINSPLEGAELLDVVCIIRAQKRLNRLYRHLEKSGGWRAVAAARGVNVYYVYQLVKHGVVPGNPLIRRTLYLPEVLPSERKTRVPKIKILLGSPGWEKEFFKRMRPQRGKGILT